MNHTASGWRARICASWVGLVSLWYTSARKTHWSVGTFDNHVHLSTQKLFHQAFYSQINNTHQHSLPKQNTISSEQLSRTFNVPDVLMFTSLWPQEPCRFASLHEKQLARIYAMPNIAWEWKESHVGAVFRVVIEWSLALAPGTQAMNYIKSSIDQSYSLWMASKNLCFMGWFGFALIHKCLKNTLISGGMVDISHCLHPKTVSSGLLFTNK